MLDPNQHLWALAPNSGTTRYYDEVGSAYSGARADIGAMCRPRYARRARNPHFDGRFICG